MDTIELKTPNGREIVIRNYTTRADDEKAEQVLYSGAVVNQGIKGEGNIVVSVGSAMASDDVYIERLVNSIDGDSKNIAFRLKELRSEDYKAVAEAVAKIVEEHSPKAIAVAND